MKDLEPKVFRQRLIIEGHHRIENLDGEILRKYLAELSKVLKMRIFVGPFCWPPDDDKVHEEALPLTEINGFVGWKESGCQAYIWPPHKFFSVDVYSCKKFDVTEAVRFTKEFFKSEDTVYKEIDMG